MSDRSKSPVKSSRLINSSTSLNLPDDEIVNGKISGDTARDIIYGEDLKHSNRIAINNKLFFVNKDYDLEETAVGFGKTKKTKKRKKVLKKTRRKKKKGKKLKKK
jgi:hypothetical protein|tara:strand:+ start:1207 stop:1521 length:315 start_codon:yes stop_codon:yes gene_type:complete